ncbi:hypothetical protein GGTG_07968 [Gaeumannomyces tritici R3-111a-1]|uniref:Kelch repeat protein n=1 Tax=Gaeumannomyces tritici (strain R3-111a-1) TaxID=644352 RepID=J3P378_GAET3|nr:hypothetical protein GGTG_07968 [Gaeumannomyces tritici R3-111a-1]EJT74120.1 hypothetical protein GGTG_07968 [Gaeumannomyces tritici R3-111a-1]
MAEPFPGFLRWSMPSVTILGDYLYVDGGEVSRLIDGQVQEPPSTQVNSTLSLSLKSSWTNSTAKWTETSRAGVPKLVKTGFWPDPRTKSFYQWAGSMVYNAIPPPNQLWRFAADGAGRGSWAEVAVPDAVGFGALVKPAACASAWGADRVGYCVSGWLDKATDTTGSRRIGIPGMVTLDMETTTFKNVSTDGLKDRGIAIESHAQSVPFGPRANSSGLLALFGGMDYDSPQFSFSNLSIYDPEQGRWHWQTTTGSRPTGRERFCHVGAAGDNGTYEIFLYGGIQADPKTTWDDVHILSLPGFVFFKAPESALSSSRCDHACAADGRQMISVGGAACSVGFPKSLTEPDPWRQALGVYDMTDLEWKAGFDGTRPAYRTPQVVKDWYAQGGQRAVSWSSDAMQRLFSPETRPDSPPGTPLNTPGSADGQATPASGLSAGATAGIAVGAVAGALIIAGLLAFAFLRRRRRRRRRLELASSTHSAKCMAAACHEIQGASFYELQAPTAELQCHTIMPFEMPGSSRPYYPRRKEDPNNVFAG